MLHLLKYQFLQTIRSRSIMFWALAFPLILGTLFYVSFGNTGLAGTGETDWEPVPVAIVTVESSSANAASFLTFLNETDQDMIDIHSYKTEKAAKKALRREEICRFLPLPLLPMALTRAFCLPFWTAMKRMLT